jgi:hypothetical protein
MHAARLTRRWQEAAGDPARMVEARVDEINDPATGFVTRDFPARRARADPRGDRDASRRAGVRGEIAGLRGEIAAVRAEIWRIVLTVFGLQSALVGVMVTILVQALR